MAVAAVTAEVEVEVNNVVVVRAECVLFDKWVCDDGNGYRGSAAGGSNDDGGEGGV